MLETKGNCKHGEFILTEGCAKCIEERRQEFEESQHPQTLFNIVKVQYLSLSTGEVSPREYTYYSIDRLAVEDIVDVPVRDTTTKAKVSAVDVPEAEIASFKDKVKTILAGSIVGLGEIAATKIHLCDTCSLRNDYPICCSDDITFGNGKENDNIIQCSKHIEGPAEPCTIPLNVEITPKPETALALRPGEDIEAHGYYVDGVGLLEYAEKRVIATLEDNQAASDDLTIISKLKKVMENKRKSLLDPLKLQADAIRETYSTLMDPILAAEKITKDKMLGYAVKQEVTRKAQEEINRLRIEAAQKDAALHNGEISEPVNLVEVMPEVSKRVVTDLGSSGKRDHWKYEIIDVNLIPREYMMPDTSMLNTTAQTHHDKKKVDGVRFYNEPIIATRAR